MKILIQFLIRLVPRKVLQKIAPWILPLIGRLYRGHNVTCPIIGKSYRKFLPYGRINPRPNALCLESMSLERHRLLWLYLKEKTDFFKTKLRVLHIAPEQCFIQEFKKQHGGYYVTGDIESPLADVQMDIHQIPFDEGDFDCVLCNHVLEHVEDDKKAIGEINRVLKKGGWAILQVPFFYPLVDITEEDPTITDPGMREKRYGQSDHVRRYGKDYADRIRSQGFKVTEDDYCSTLPEETRTKYALPKDEIIYFCEKI